MTRSRGCGVLWPGGKMCCLSVCRSVGKSQEQILSRSVLENGEGSWSGCVSCPPHVGSKGGKWGFICLESTALWGKISNLMYFLALWAIFYKEGVGNTIVVTPTVTHKTSWPGYVTDPPYCGDGQSNGHSAGPRRAG